MIEFCVDTADSYLNRRYKVTSKRPGRFESILSSFADAVIILDPGGKIEWLNSAAEQILGVSRNMACGHPVSFLFPDDSPVHAAVEQALEERISLTDHDTSVKTRRGEEVPVGLTVHPMYEEEEGGAVVILRDLGALKALERYITQNERAMEMAGLVAGVAHEIKNPLGGIRGAAQLWKREAGGERAEEYAELIISEVDRINRMVVDLIDLNKTGAILKEPVNIYPILDKVLSLLKDAVRRKNIKIVREFDPSLPSALGDPDRLSQVFLNLLKNAVEVCGRGGRVTIRTSLAWNAPLSASNKKERRFALIEIMDEGPGLDDEAKKGIFTPFFSKKSGGFGLGLAMTQRLVRAHGGILELSNRADRSGAIAFVYLPYSA